MENNKLNDDKLKKLLLEIKKNKPEFGTVNLELSFHQGDLKKALVMRTEKMLFNETVDNVENGESNEKLNIQGGIKW